MTHVVVASLVRDRDWCITDTVRSWLTQKFDGRLSAYFILNDSTDRSGTLLMQAVERAEGLHGVRIDVRHYGCPPLDRALRLKDMRYLLALAGQMGMLRSELMAGAIGLYPTHVLMVDSDVLFPSNDVIARLLAHQHRVVAPAFPYNPEGDIKKACNAFRRIDEADTCWYTHTWANRQELQEVGAIGGCWLMNMEAAATANFYLDPLLTEQEELLGWIDINGFGEDTRLALNWRAAGIRLWLDEQCVVKHLWQPEAV